MKPVVIVGGGLSGLAAGVMLGAHGIPVSLLEQKPFLGGRAYSFRDRETGETIDNGQHLLILGYGRTMELLRTLGTADRLLIPGRAELTFHHPVRGFATLRLPRLSPPLHVLSGAMRSPLFSGADVTGLIRVRRAFGRMSAPDVATMSIRRWLSALEQSEELVRSFWEPLALAIMNERPDRASALVFMRSLRTAFLSTWHSAAMAVPKVGLSELFAHPAADHIRRHGGKIRPGREVLSLEGDKGGVTAVCTREGETHPCSAVILAVPPARARTLLECLSPGLAQVPECAYSPIVSIHLWFESDFMPQNVVGLIGRRIQWVFNRRRITGTGSAGHLSATISAAREYVSLSNEELLRIAREDLGSVYGHAAERLIRGVVIRERQATISLTPELEPLRPDASLPLGNLFLAGDWTATGYPATIEGAVISGERAAALLLRRPGRTPGGSGG